MSSFGFTEKEKQLLKALDECSTVSMASNKLREMGLESMTPQNCYATLYRIRERYKEARTFTNNVLSLRQRSKLLKKVLTPKVAME